MVNRRRTAGLASGAAIAGIAVALSFAALLSGCGVRGSLENPQSAQAKEKATAESGQGRKEDEAPKPHKDFILDRLIR